MSLRSILLASVGAFAIASPAFAFQTNFTALTGAATPLVAPSGDNTLTFSSPGDPGVFSVGATVGLFQFAAGLGDFSSFGGDTLNVAFAAPVSKPFLLTFGIEDLFGLSGSDTLSVTTNTGASYTFGTILDTGVLEEPEGYGVINSPGLTSLTITSVNPFAIGQITTVPEPASMALLGVSLAGLLAARRRR